MKRGTRNIDGVIVNALPPRKRFEQKPRFLAAAAAELGNHERSVKTRNDVGRVALEQPHPGSAQTILGQQADHVE